MSSFVNYLEHRLGKQLASIKNAAYTTYRDLSPLEIQFFDHRASREAELMTGFAKYIDRNFVAVERRLNDEAGKPGDAQIVDLWRIDRDDQVLWTRRAKVFGRSFCKSGFFAATI